MRGFRRENAVELCPVFLFCVEKFLATDQTGGQVVNQHIQLPVNALPLEPQTCGGILLFLLCLCQFGGMVDFMDQPLYINDQCYLLV